MRARSLSAALYPAGVSLAAFTSFLHPSLNLLASRSRQPRSEPAGSQLSICSITRRPRQRALDGLDLRMRRYASRSRRRAHSSAARLLQRLLGFRGSLRPSRRLDECEPPRMLRRGYVRRSIELRKLRHRRRRARRSRSRPAKRLPERRRARRCSLALRIPAAAAIQCIDRRLEAYHAAISGGPNRRADTWVPRPADHAAATPRPSRCWNRRACGRDSMDCGSRADPTRRIRLSPFCPRCGRRPAAARRQKPLLPERHPGTKATPFRSGFLPFR